MQTGINLSRISYWGSDSITRDIAKSVTKPFPLQKDTAIVLDDNGNVSSISPSSGHYQFFFQNANKSKYTANSRFVCTYLGKGNVDYLGGVLLSRTNHGNLTLDQFALDSKNPSSISQITLKVGNIDPSNYPREFRIWEESSLIVSLAESLNNEQNSIFNPLYLQKLDCFSVLRAMDLMRINESSVKEFSDFLPYSYQNWTELNGVPLQALCLLANETKKDIWINIPHLASDDCVDKMGDFFKKNLDPKIKVYVEYSNECWNYSYGQSRYLLQQAGDFYKQQVLYAQKTNNCISIFEKHLPSDRVIGVVSWQLANVGGVQKNLLPNCPKAKILAVAPYFGNYIGNSGIRAQVTPWLKEPDGGLNSLFAEMQKGLSQVLSQTSAYKKVIDAVNLERSADQQLQLATYESGQGLQIEVPLQNTPYGEQLSELFQSAQYDTRMGALYTALFTGLKDLGVSLNTPCCLVSTYGHWGYWGLLESITQSGSIKYDTVKACTQYS